MFDLMLIPFERALFFFWFCGFAVRFCNLVGFVVDRIPQIEAKDLAAQIIVAVLSTCQ